jgi:hypothetical protein
MLNFSTFFLYRPKNGDRVFADSTCREVRTLRWLNGCRHVMYASVPLVYKTAEAGKHWRAEARRVAEYLVEQYGGIAWDERGTITLIVSPDHVVAADLEMCATAALSGVDATAENTSTAAWTMTEWGRAPEFCAVLDPEDRKRGARRTVLLFHEPNGSVVGRILVPDEWVDAPKEYQWLMDSKETHGRWIGDLRLISPPLAVSLAG